MHPLLFALLLVLAELKDMTDGDKEHHRAGYGGGFYDRYLEQHPVFYKAAVAFSFQIVDHIETESYDLKPDCIITEQAVL